MYGVVLWSDTSDQKAVIWCEDHGDLAFYCGATTSALEAPLLDAGDLVHFQVTEGAPMRLASNPEIVTECHAPAIAERLKAAMKQSSEKSKPEAPVASNVSSRLQENVIPFRLSIPA